MPNQQKKSAGFNPPGVFVAAPRPGDGQWTPVGYLTRKDVSPDAPPSGPFMFSYVQAAKDNKLPHLWWGTPDWKSLYSSSELLPPFSWRVRSESRKDYRDYLSALDLTREEVRHNLFTLLARTEGQKVTDGFEIFAKPIPKDGHYDIPFFLRGLHHFLKSGEDRFNSVVSRIKALQQGEELLLALDPQNPADPGAVAVLTADRMLIGYCPRYLAREFRRFLVQDGPASGNLKVRVQKVNLEGSLSLMLLCRLTCDATSTFAPCEGPDFEILSPEMRELTAAQGENTRRP